MKLTSEATKVVEKKFLHFVRCMSLVSIDISLLHTYVQGQYVIGSKWERYIYIDRDRDANINLQVFCTTAKLFMFCIKHVYQRKMDKASARNTVRKIANCQKTALMTNIPVPNVFLDGVGHIVIKVTGVCEFKYTCTKKICTKCTYRLSSA